MNTEDPDVSNHLQEYGINAVPFIIIEDRETNEKEEVLGFNLTKLQNIFSEWKAESLVFLFQNSSHLSLNLQRRWLNGKQRYYCEARKNS